MGQPKHNHHTLWSHCLRFCSKFQDTFSYEKEKCNLIDFFKIVNWILKFANRQFFHGKFWSYSNSWYKFRNPRHMSFHICDNYYDPFFSNLINRVWKKKKRFYIFGKPAKKINIPIWFLKKILNPYYIHI